MKHIYGFLFTAGAALTLFSCSTDQPTDENNELKYTPKGRAEYEFNRLKDPVTNEIPENIQTREWLYAQTLPKTGLKYGKTGTKVYTHSGPNNLGGRTRALAVDIENSDRVLAGGVSGGMWLSTDGGDNWTKTTASDQNPAVSCVVQDRRAGQTSTWYYGSGEKDGNSPSKSFSAVYRGTGVYKSTDNGLTWVNLASTNANTPQKSSTWDYIYTMEVDDTRNDSDIVFAALSGGIMRSNNGGTSWTSVLSGTSSGYSFITQGSNGVFYASISGTGTNGVAGYYRSVDGISWQKMNHGINYTHERTILATDPQNGNRLYVYSYAPGYNSIDIAFLRADISANGNTITNQQWVNLSNFLPATNYYTGMDTQGGYNMSLAVSPENSNYVYIGSTNLFRSNNGFTSSGGRRQIGGYRIDGMNGYDYSTGIQHPDQHNLFFDPNNPSILYASSDGGVHKTSNPGDNNVNWESKNLSYKTSQFYSVAVEHTIAGNEDLIGGLQDNGTWWTDDASEDIDWESIRGADGGYVAIEDGANAYYTSTQYANVERTKINKTTGNVTSRRTVMPPSGGGYLFIHPFTLTPDNTNEMFIPNNGGDLWYSSNLAAADNGNEPWSLIGSVNGTITALEASNAADDIVYVGTNSRRIFKITNARSGNATVTDVTNNIQYGGYTSCITIDPYNVDHVFVIYSNYNTVSIYETLDGGQTWANIEGNLKGNSDPGVPPQLGHIGDGPSLRWIEVLEVDNHNVYFVGTSVGLFASDNLAGDSTEWIQQGANTIGNVVVDMIDLRQNDGFTAIGTHGNGIYTAFNDDINHINSTDQTLYENNLNVKLFPNPVVDQLNISFDMPYNESVKIDIYNIQGQLIQRVEKTAFPEGHNTYNVNVSQLPHGQYILHMKGKSFSKTSTFVK